MEFKEIEAWIAGSYYVYLPQSNQLYRKTAISKCSLPNEKKIYYKCLKKNCKSAINIVTNCSTAKSCASKVHHNHNDDSFLEYKRLECLNEIRRRVKTEIISIKLIFDAVLNR
jgi:hypothetical protein